MTLGEDSVGGRECNQLYAHCRDVELRAHPWVFAKKRVQLAASSTAPAFGAARAFPVPSDYLILHWDIYDTASSSGVTPRDWTIENHDNSRAILTDDAAPLNVVYIARITDVSVMDELFQEALANRISLGFTEKITQSNTKRKLAKEDYTDAITEARRIGAIESRPQEAEQDSWLTARL